MTKKFKLEVILPKDLVATVISLVADAGVELHVTPYSDEPESPSVSFPKHGSKGTAFTNSRAKTALKNQPSAIGFVREVSNAWPASLERTLNYADARRLAEKANLNPNTGTTLLSLIVRAGFAERIARGQYRLNLAGLRDHCGLRS